MVKYVGSFIGGILVGFAFLAMSSCAEKKVAVDVVDAGSVVGTMEVGTPTVTVAPAPVNPQITDAVTQSVTPVAAPQAVQSVPEKK